MPKEQKQRRKKLTKPEFIELVSNKADTTKVDSNKILDAILETITEELSKGNEITFTGFGTFTLTKRQAREGRNPRTGEAIKIPAKTVPAFKAGKTLKEEVSG